MSLQPPAHPLLEQPKPAATGLGEKSSGSSNTHIIILVVIIVAVVVAAGAVAGFYFLPSAGASETQTMNFSGFTAVNVGSAFRVTITHSNSFTVRITANEKEFDQIEVNQTGDILKIDIRPGNFTGITNTAAQITMPELNSVTLSGATQGSAAGFRSTMPFVAQLSGASSLTLTDFQAGNVTADLSGASTLSAAGSADDLVSVVSGASSLNLTNLAVNNASMNLSEASHAQIDVSGRLDAELSGASSLQYIGQPTLGNISTSGESTVSKS